MHEDKNLKNVGRGSAFIFFKFYLLCLVDQLCLTLYDPMDCSLPDSSVQGDSPGKNTGVGCHAVPLGDLPHPGIEPRSSSLQVDSLPSEPPGKPIYFIILV